MSAKLLHIKGRVQGVFFRATAQELALKLGIRGWIRNAPDGAVEIHAEGDETSLIRFIDWCGNGPEGAEVSSIDIRDAEEENRPSFEIIR